MTRRDRKTPATRPDDLKRRTDAMGDGLRGLWAGDFVAPWDWRRKGS